MNFLRTHGYFTIISMVTSLAKAKNILFINHLLAMGDAIFLSAVFRAIKEFNPETHISVLTRAYSVEFLKSVRYVDHVVCLEDFHIAADMPKVKKVLPLLKLAAYMKRFDHIVMRNDARIPLTRFFNLAARLSRHQGIIHMDGFLSRFLSPDRHILDTYKEVLNELGFEIIDRMKSGIELTDKGRQFADRTLGADGHPVVGIVPSSNLSIKNIPVDVVAGIMNSDVLNGDRIILFSMDEKLNEEICRKSFVKPIVVGRLEFEELMGLIARCRLVISADTGPLHLAAAIGVPTIGIYGPTSGRVTGPYGENCHVIQVTPDCPYYNPVAPYSPDSQLQSCYVQDKCRIAESSCMKNVTIDEITDAVRKYVKHDTGG